MHQALLRALADPNQRVDVACPRCGVAAGERCVSVHGGGELGWSHSSREKLPPTP